MTKHLTLLLFIGLAWAQDDIPQTTDELMNMAFEKARNENKNILLIFYANWCDPCSLYTEALINKESKIFFDSNYVIVKLDAHGKQYEINEGAKEYYEELMESMLHIVARTFYQSEEYYIDKKQRRIFDHLHWHARNNGFNHE